MKLSHVLPLSLQLESGRVFRDLWRISTSCLELIEMQLGEMESKQIGAGSEGDGADVELLIPEKSLCTLGRNHSALLALTSPLPVSAAFKPNVRPALHKRGVWSHP